MNFSKRSIIYGLVTTLVIFLVALGFWFGKDALKPTASQEEPMNDFVVLALERARENDAEGAIEALNIAIASDPDGADEAYYYRGIIHAQLGDLGASRADLDLAIAANPHKPEYFAARGTTYAALGRPASAIEDFNKALELSPDHAPTIVNRGQAYMQLEIYDLAFADYTRAIELNPDIVAAYFNRGVLYLQTEEIEKAIEDFGICIDLDPEIPAPYFNRAVAYMEADKLDLALADLTLFMTLTDDENTLHQAEMLMESIASGEGLSGHNSETITEEASGD